MATTIHARRARKTKATDLQREIMIAALAYALANAREVHAIATDSPRRQEAIADANTAFQALQNVVNKVKG